MPVCPDCGDNLKRVGENLYRCPNTGLYYRTRHGQPGWPLAEPPKKREELITQPKTTLDLWREFLKEWGLTNEQYRNLPQTLKDFYRYHFQMWLKQREKEIEQKLREAAVARIIG